jgi:hypothetical protein
MKNPFLLLCVVLATLFACNSDSLSTDDMEKKGGERPFKAKNLEGTYEYGPGVEPSIGCDGQDFTGEDLFGLIAEGGGTISHLGLSTVLEEWCWSIPDLFVNGNIGERMVTFTAANGDQLVGEITSIVYPGLEDNDFSVFIEEVNITGGSGRFENACGTITQTVVTSEDDESTPDRTFGTFTYSAEGTIKYNCNEE